MCDSGAPQSSSDRILWILTNGGGKMKRSDLRQLQIILKRDTKYRSSNSGDEDSK
jgi:hypothetical protein